MTKRTRPLMSNLFREIDLDLVSGVPLQEIAQLMKL